VIRKLRLFVGFAPEERRLTVEALLLPVAISAGFRLAGVPHTQAGLRRWARCMKYRVTQNTESDIRMARRAQQRVKRATGILGPCLVRSLTLWAMLLRRGHPVNLRVGFRKRAGEIEGHAWVEYDNIPINEDTAEAGTFVVYDQPVCFDMWRTQKRPESMG
jgi:hypothetical protein